MHINHWQLFKNNKLGMAGLTLLLLLALGAYLIPQLAQGDPLLHTPFDLEAPSRRHFLGTNDVGQDNFVCLFLGAQTSLMVAIGVAVISTFISIITGVSAALFKWLDQLILRWVDVMLVIPPLVVMMIVATYTQMALWQNIILLALLSWPPGTKLLRSKALTLLTQNHVLAAKGMGATGFYLVRRHILPDLTPLLIANLVQTARRAVFLEAGLSFWGLTSPEIVSWGKMFATALAYLHLEVWKWWLLPIGLALSLTLLCLNWIGSAWEEAINPQVRRRLSVKH